ncbi:hypothetical protein AcW1_007539 [Taiwanofungus camphoratus]|nr:hypothetical protein AcW1_007539 [Antrodia cinnamomea]
MATVTHYIYSHYDPQQQEALERETGQLAEVEEADPWQTESSFGAQRRLATAPRFVPAIISYDEINDMMGLPQTLPEVEIEESVNDVGSWYRSLTRSVSAPALETGEEAQSAASIPTSLSSAAAASRGPSGTPSQLEPSSCRREPQKNDWFIRRALRSEPPVTRPASAPTLADMLSREPPPLPSEKPFTPPVFLALGPSNKGFTMLQQSGWNEGEPLGAHVVRRQNPVRTQSRKVKRDEDCVKVKKEEREVKYDEDGEVNEVRRIDVIDLTLSDSEDEDEQAEDEVQSPLAPEQPSSAVEASSPSYEPRALLTPLPTVLKSDRLGLGLKAKTVGPYKASKKRVTHNAAALAAHERANEEMRRMKALVGRGSKSFARIARAEAESRRKLLAGLNQG